MYRPRDDFWTDFCRDKQGIKIWIIKNDKRMIPIRMWNTVCDSGK